MSSHEAYHLAQSAMADLKAAVHAVLADAPLGGLTHVQIGRTLGIYGGERGHEGDLARAVLTLLEQEGVAEQEPETLCWRLVDQSLGA